MQASWVFEEKMGFCYYYLISAKASCVGRIAPQPSCLNNTAGTECPVWWAEPGPARAGIWMGKVWTRGHRQSLLVFGLDEGFDACAIPLGKSTALGFPICKQWL